MLAGRRSESAAARHLRLGVTAVAVIAVVGTIGLTLSEHFNPLESLYDTLGLMTTSGGFDRPRTDVGRVLAIALLISGVSALFYTLGALAEFLIEGHFGRALARRRMDRRIGKLTGHAIICGYGRVGRQIAQELAQAKKAFVVVDVLEANAELLEREGHPYLHADATTDEALLEAGIKRAAVLLAATDADTENIAITLSARALAPDLRIVARANHDETEAKLLRAGANRVLSPYRLGGHRMATLARSPHLVDFLDTAMESGGLDLALEEMAVAPDSPLVGLLLPVTAAGLPPVLRDATIIAVRPAGTDDWETVGERAGAPIRPGDYLIVLRTGGASRPPS